MQRQIERSFGKPILVALREHTASGARADRRLRQAARQQIIGRIDRGLNLLLSNIETEIQAELQCYEGGPAELADVI